MNRFHDVTVTPLIVPKFKVSLTYELTVEPPEEKPCTKIVSTCETVPTNDRARAEEIAIMRVYNYPLASNESIANVKVISIDVDTARTEPEAQLEA